ncbi:hypothetical protein [Mitsuokella multacida]|uniref:hypothetical protein n=1 Tax=Mitsuokella multacida TaxID=52226 RepID=UPI0022E2B81C|nr:hypothetical protein [Mitsuokella multacida]
MTLPKNYACYKAEGPADGIQRLANALPCPSGRQKLSGNWQVLTFTVEWDTSVGMEPWRKLQQSFVPEGSFYYRVENIEEHRVVTNDWYKKYFGEDCLLCVTHDAGRKSKMLDRLREMLMLEKFAVPDANGNKIYRSYWINKGWCYSLREILGLRRRDPIDACEILWQKAWEWDVDYDFSVSWAFVERKKEDVPTHCQQCSKMLEIQQRNHYLRRRYKMLKQEMAKAIRKLQIREAICKQHDPLILKRIEQGKHLLKEIECSEMQK